jgi:hypothetical protein
MRESFFFFPAIQVIFQPPCVSHLPTTGSQYQQDPASFITTLTGSFNYPILRLQYYTYSSILSFGDWRTCCIKYLVNGIFFYSCWQHRKNIGFMDKGKSE